MTRHFLVRYYFKNELYFLFLMVLKDRVLRGTMSIWPAGVLPNWSQERIAQPYVSCTQENRNVSASQNSARNHETFKTLNWYRHFLLKTHIFSSDLLTKFEQLTHVQSKILPLGVKCFLFWAKPDLCVCVPDTIGSLLSGGNSLQHAAFIKVRSYWIKCWCKFSS